MSRPTPSSVLRLALTPRWLVALGLVVLFIAAAVLLGRWQWDRTQSILAAERAAASQPIAVQDVFAGSPAGDVPTELPAEAIGRPVTVTGEYDADRQVVVTNRLHDDRPGVWVVTGLTLPDGRLVPVVRGWLPDAASPGVDVPAGAVTATGVLQPDEPFYADAATPAGTVAAIAQAGLSAEWGADVLPGFVVLESQQPTSTPAPVPIEPTVRTADVPFPLQNFFYAFQWWIFAAFGLAVYLRWLWLEARRLEQEA